MSDILHYRCNMADDDFVRDENSHALINSDTNGFESYKMHRQRAKRQISFEERISELERLVKILMKE